MTIPVKQNLVHSSKYSLKCPYSMDATEICVHNTAMDSSAANEIAYMIRNNSTTSYHFAIDDKEVVQGIPTNRNAFHAGDGGSGTGNRKFIGIEICYSKSGGERYKKAEELAVKFIAQLLHERNWDVSRVKKHQDFSGKRCPHRILSEGRWDSFLNAIQSELNKFNQPKPQPKTEIKKQGGERMLNLQDWQWEVISDVLRDQHNDGILSSPDWEVKARNKELSVDESILLIYASLGKNLRRLKDK